MTVKETHVTPEGLKKMEAELEHLKTVCRKNVAEKIKVARGYGDLSENADYDAAKDEQGELEGKIAELENKLKNVHLINSDELSPIRWVWVSPFVWKTWMRKTRILNTWSLPLPALPRQTPTIIRSATRALWAPG